MKHFKHLLFLSILCSLVLFTNCGDSDDVVPFEELKIAADALVKSEFEVYTLTSKGTGHSIGEDALRAALQFIKNIL